MAGDGCCFLGFCRAKLRLLDVYSARGAASFGTRDVSSPAGVGWRV